MFNGDDMVIINCRYTSHHFAIRKVIHGIVAGLYKQSRFKKVTLLVNKNNLADFEAYRDCFDIRVIPVHSDSALLNHFFNIFVLPFVLLFSRAKVIVFPQISFFVFTGIKTVVFIHDLIEYKIRNQKLSKHIVRHVFFPWIAKHSNLIVTVSENSKADIVQILGVPADKVLVTYDGVDHILPYAGMDRQQAIEYVENTYGIKNYALYVGYLSLPQKNLIFLLQSLKVYFEKYSDHNTHVVFVGPKGKDHELVFEEVERLGLVSRFKYLGTLSEKDLGFVYKAANVFCFPSLYEGFGMPVAEAMACGCPVISSNRSSLPEVVQGAGILVDPEDILGMSEALHQILRDQEKWQAFSTAGLQNAKRFTWGEAASQLSFALEKL